MVIAYACLFAAGLCALRGATHAAIVVATVGAAVGLLYAVLEELE